LGQVWAIFLAGLAAGCATAQPVADPQFASQLHAMASRQVDLERKVDRLEARVEALRARPPSAAPTPAPVAAAETSRVPKDLATVKLAPQAHKAPAIPTAVALHEPDPGKMDSIFADAPSSEIDTQLAAAKDAIRTGEPERGARDLVRFADKNPRDPRASDALFEAGLGLMTSGDPQMATLLFERVADDYPLSDRAPDALMRLADCQTKMKHPAQAREVLAKVVNRYPGTPAARAAEAGLKSLAESPAAQ